MSGPDDDVESFDFLFVDDAADVFGDADDGDDGRGAWAESLGPLDDTRTDSEIGAEQWRAAFADAVALGQMTPEAATWAANLDPSELEAYYEDAIIVEVDTDAPDGDTP